MNSLQDYYVRMGAQLAPDGIPLHFGDQKEEYQAALSAALLLDRSHEARVRLTGADGVDLLNRISTNSLSGLQPGEGRPTIFTNANARIIDRIQVYYSDEDALLLLGGPGRGTPLSRYLQRNIFYNDRVECVDVGPVTCQFALHGPQAGAVLAELDPQVRELSPTQGLHMTIGGHRVFAGRDKPLVGECWQLVVPSECALDVWQTLLNAGTLVGLRPSGGLVYNVLRIRAGIPGFGRELTSEYIPLEVGLWDEVSFTKGCYTGQEIIARMESRERLARTIVYLEALSTFDVPLPLFRDGKQSGYITSSVASPVGEIFTIGVVKTAAATPDETLNAGQPDGPQVRIIERLGVQPPYLD